MMNSDSHTLEGTPAQLARILRCSEAEFITAFKDLRSTDAAVTSERNGVVTLTSRRRKREIEARENGRNRVARFRQKQNGNANVPSVSVSVSDSSAKGVQGETVITQLKRELCQWFQKPESERWGYEAEHLLVEVSQSPTVIHELHTIKSYYSKTGAFRRTSIPALLQNWSGELDKARTHEPEIDGNTKPNPRNTGIATNPNDQGKAIREHFNRKANQQSL